MTRSIFDPTGGETEHSGSTHGPARADNNSHMPPSAVDGDVEQGQGALDVTPADADDNPAPIATSSEEAAQNLQAMRPEDEGPTDPDYRRA